MSASSFSSQASIATTSFNILNNMVGSGLLSIPWCLKILGGSNFGSIFLLIIAFTTWMSFTLIGIVCSKVKTIRNFEELSTIAGFPPLLVKTCLALYTCLSCLSYVLLTCDFVAGDSGLARYSWSCTESSHCSWLIQPFRHRSFFVLFLSLFVLYPFSRFKDLSSLKKVSILSFFAMILMMLIAFKTYVDRDETEGEGGDEHNVTSRNVFPRGIFLAHPIFLISFTAHYNAPKFYSELKDATPSRFALASGIAVFCSFLIYGFFGILSFETFKEETHPDVLENYSSDSLIAVFARLSMAIVVLTTYPLAFQALKGTIPSSSFPFPLEYLDYILILTTTFPAILLRDIGMVLDYKGSVFGGIISLLIPALGYLKTLNYEERVGLIPDEEEEEIGGGQQQQQQHGEFVELTDVEMEQQERKCSTTTIRKYLLRYVAGMLCVWAVIASIGGFIVTTARAAGKLEKD